MKKYSSSYTVFYKFLAVIGIPIIIVTVYFAIPIGSNKSFYSALYPFLPFFIAYLFLVVYSYKLKQVFITDDSIILSDSFKSIKLPLSKVKKVYEWPLIFNPRTATIKFEEKTAFGSSITFLPNTKFFIFFKTHPDITSLRKAVEKAKKEKLSLDEIASLPIEQQADALFAEALTKQKNGEVALALRYFNKTVNAAKNSKDQQIQLQEIIAESHLRRAGMMDNGQFPNKKLIEDLEYAQSVFAELKNPLKQIECIYFILRELSVNRMRTRFRFLNNLFNNADDERKIRQCLEAAHSIKEHNLGNHPVLERYNEIEKIYKVS